MSDLKLHPWEPEETIGTIWHRFVTRDSGAPDHPDAAVSLEQMHTRICLLFRGLGGDAGTQITEAATERVAHRRSLWRRLGHGGNETSCHPVFDGETLALPPQLTCFPDRKLNEALYLWLAAYAAHDVEMPDQPHDPLQRDLHYLRHCYETTQQTLRTCPGLHPTFDMLCRAVLAQRGTHPRPAAEQALEMALQHLLGGAAGDDDLSLAFMAAITAPETDLSGFTAPKGYYPFERALLWPERRQQPELSSGRRDDAQPAGGGNSTADGKRRKAARHKADQANRKDSLILHRFETIISWTDFLNLNRRIEDDDDATARKAADDANELGVTDIDQRPATRLAFDLDMAPHDVDRERLAGEFLYPEWDYRRRAYHDGHARILLGDVHHSEDTKPTEKSPQLRRRLNAVRRQFEALRPRRLNLPRQVDGEDFDLDAIVQSQVDIAVSGQGSDRIYRRIANQERDLAVCTLIDTSRSTESIVAEQPVIEIARNSLLALGHGLAACGDAYVAISAVNFDVHQLGVNMVYQPVIHQN